jgi:uncharacterized protein YycO
MVVERWRKGTPDQFWAEFSGDGKNMSFTAITKRLRQIRVTEDQELAEKARQEYGDSFATTFSYRRGGNIYIMTDPTTIANHYRSL